MTSRYDPHVARSGAQPDATRHVADPASPVPPAAGWPPAPQAQPGDGAAAPAFPAAAAFPASGAPVSNAGEPTALRPGPMPPQIDPAQPAAPFAGSSQGAAPFAGSPQAAPASGAGWEPSAGYPRPYTPPSPHGPPTFAALGAPAPSAPKRRLAWPVVTALLLVVVLGSVAGFQAYQIQRLDDRLTSADRRLTEAQAGQSKRLDSLDGRATQLEKQAGDVFNPEAISTAVLPSVFRVSAGDFTGTAFAVGKPASGGGTNLFTNFHVVESVWNNGGRRVFIERRDQRFPATIVKVDKVNDVAQLKTDGKFTGLVPAREPVKSGQQIVVIGAPLGLEDTVTTGVVSAFRKSPDGNGTVIQFDAPINPGNSGGPVINRSKQVVGIATAKARDAEGIGLAVPIRTACDQFKIC